MAANGALVSQYQGLLSKAIDPLLRRTEFTNDAYGRVTKTTDSTGGDVLYAYDNQDELLSVTDPENNTTSYQYDRDNQPTRETRLEGGVIQYSYNLAGKVATTTDAKGQQARYTYNDAGNIDTKQSEHGLYNYSYDSLDRLTQADNPTLPNEAYTYDGVGNRMTDNSKPGTWSYNTDNQLTNIDNQMNFTYDANGSLVQKTDNGVTTDYQYNLESRLTGITRNGSAVASYGYDPFGRRLWKETNGQRTWFLYAEEGLIAEFDGTGTSIRQYGYKPDGIWGTDPIFQKAGGQYYFYQKDHLGTPQKLVKTNGAVVWSAKYQVFGGAQVDAGSTIQNPLRFPGQYYDQETGLHYNYYRYYEPRTGRYLTSDPIELFGGLNAYAYADDNMLRYIDPLGLAYFDNRPLEGMHGNPNRSPLADWLNTELSHEQLFFEDEKGGNVGFFGDGEVRPDDPNNLNKYWGRRREYYDDRLMREAVDNVGNPGTYCLIGPGQNNCQDWADKVRKEYERLRKERNQCSQ